VNVFCHINEFKVPGFALLASTLRFSRSLTLWSPSPWLMERSRQQGDSLIGPKEMLRLVEERKVVVMGRPDYLIDERFRIGHALGDDATWYPQFDGVIKAWAKEDEHRTEKRVLLVNRETDRVNEWAEKQLRAKSKSAKIALHRYNDAKLPPVPLAAARKQQQEHAGRGKNGIEAAVKQVLVDARLHEDAFRASGATVPLETAECGGFALDIVNEPRTLPSQALAAPDAQAAASHLVDLLQFSATLNAPQTTEELFKALEDPRREELISEIAPWVDKSIPLLDLYREIKAGRRVEEAIDKLANPGGAADFAGIIATLIIAMEHFRHRKWLLRGKKTAATRRKFMLLSLASIGLGLDAGRRYLTPKTTYTGPRFPFLLAYGYGTADPSYSQIEWVLAKLDLYLKQHPNAFR
jgi:hypothetical protein